MSKLNVFQPWSVPLLQTSLPDKVIQELIQLTDLITEDKERESMNKDLAGEIEDEWKIDPILLTNIKFTEYVIQLSWEYFKIVLSNFQMVDNKIPKNDPQGVELKTAWFNNQKDNEYNPMHAHKGIFSGVLYLKIPEYLPSRKRKETDGSIEFIGNEIALDLKSITKGMISNSTMNFFPKVGDIFLFPSSLKHIVYPFRTTDGKGIRRSLSFNLDTKHEEVFTEAGVTYVRKTD